MSNNAPNITSAEVTSVNEDTDYSYTFTATDVDSGDTVTLAAPTKPSWLSFNPGTGVLSGTPANRNIGDHSIVLSATDVLGAVTTQNFIITVNNVNDAPTVNNAISDQATAENSAFSYQFASDVFADVDIGDNLTNTATLSDGSDLPSWLKFDADTRTFSGTPLNLNVGDIAVKVTATDSSSATGSDTFNITVTNINDAPSITSSEVTSVNEDTDYSYTFTATDVDSGDTVTLAAPTKPSWLSFNPGTGVLSGMPTNSNIGNHSIVLSATDVVGAVTTQNFTINVTTTLETNGDYDLAHDGDNYYIIDSNDNKLGLTFLGKPVGPNKWDGWSATQVEESLSGGYEVLWSHSGGRTWVWKADASGAYVSGITGRTVVENETIFKADLDLDGYTGTPPPTTLETNGNYELAHGSDKYYIVDDNDNRLELNYLGNPIGPNKWDGWSATQVEESLSGGFEVLWSHNNGNTWVWKVDVSGNYESAITGRTVAENEIIFDVDLDLDGYTGIPPTTTLETNGDYELANGSDNYYIIDDNDNKLGLTYYGKPIGPNKWNGWSATQVEESASGGFEVLWSHNNGNTWVWKFNASGNYESAITGRTVAENEIIFDVDLDLDGYTGIPPTTTLETNGDYELAHGSDNYYIIDDNDNKLGLTYYGKPLGPNKWDGWSATQVEESASGGFEVLWSHSGGRTWVWKTDASGAYVSAINPTLVERETTFEVDLDEDGYVAIQGKPFLEDNGDYKLVEGGGQYHIVDGNGDSIRLTNGSDPFGSNGIWKATQVEESTNPSGGFEILLANDNGKSLVWKVDATGAFENQLALSLLQKETTFEVDLDEDNHIGIPPTTTLETNGDYQLANGSDNYYIIDDNDNKLGLTYYGKPIGPNKWNGWSATQVEESASGGFEVLWSHNNGNTWVWKFNASGNYESAITGRTVAENEIIFDVDLDLDGYTGIPPTTTLETNGDYELAHGGNKYYIEVTGSDVIYLEETGNFRLGKQGDQHYILDADGNGIRFDMPKYAPGYFYTDTPLHVEEGLDYVGFQNDFPDGNFWVLFQRQEWASKGGGYNKGYMARKYDASGNYNGSDIVKTGNLAHLRHYMEYEAMFGVDLNKDGKIAIGINPNNLMDISGNKHHEDDATKSVSISLKYSGKVVGPNKWDGWSAAQVEESASGGFEALWSHSGGRTWVWKADASGNYVSTINRTIAENEAIFEVDLDGDGVIGLNFKMVDITGDYKLAKAANQYHIIKSNDATADIISFGNTGTNGFWSVKQVEASASGGYELFHVHNDGRTMVHKVDAAGHYQNHIYRSIAQNETIFLVDLNGDGYTNIETNGDYTLALHRASHKYYILDGNGVSIGLTNIHGSPVGPGTFTEKNSIWKAVQVEESVAGFEVLWSDVGTAAMPDIQWRTDATGKFQKYIFNSFSDYLELRETIFEADLNGDGLITIETNGNFKIIGGHGNDTIDGGAGNDTLDGGTGADTITTGSGSDQIILRSGDGGNAFSDADIITDFSDGNDVFGLTKGLSFGDLTRASGTNDYANDSIISYGSEYLAILRNIDVNDLTEDDFVNVDIA